MSRTHHHRRYRHRRGDPSCNPHGACAWCLSNRTHAVERQDAIADDTDERNDEDQGATMNTDTLSRWLDRLAELEHEATPGPIRVNKAHDLWLELRAGSGLSNTMVADCVSKPDGDLLTAARNSLPAMIEALRAAAEAIECVEWQAGQWGEPPVPCVRLSEERMRKMRAALAKLAEIAAKEMP